MDKKPEAERIAYNALALKTMNEYGKLSRLKERYGSWENAFREISNEGASLDAYKAYEELNEQGVRLILEEEAEYPEALREIAHAPFGLYIKGTWPAPKQLGGAIAVVGTRKAGDEGVVLAEEISRSIAAHGLAIVSGLALGIDRAAHTGALEANGITWAVLANGLHEVYPAHHKALAERILSSGGALISEYTLGSPSLPYRFIERNRIVSGLCCGIVVIEAPERSGARATARFAVEQNREVFVTPGIATSYNYKGSHALIREGARLITSAEEILEDLGLKDQATPAELFTNEEEKRIIAFLRERPEGARVEDIVETLDLNPQEVNQTLSFLTIRTLIKEHGDRYQIS